MNSWQDFGNGIEGLETPGGWLFRYELGGLAYVPDMSKEMAPLEPPTPPPPLPPPLLVPNKVNNMELVGDEWHSKPGWESTIADIEFLIPGIKHGSLVTVTFKRKGNVVYSGNMNMKVFRVWKDKTGAYPNSYLGRQVDGSWVWYTEKLPPVTNVNRFYCKFPSYTEEWREETWQWRVNSSVGSKDGELVIAIEGKPILLVSGVQFDDAASPGVANVICVEDDISNGVLPTGSWVSYRDIQITVQ
jgi:hypothetical protein